MAPDPSARKKVLRVVLLAPITVVGGITTWTRCLLKYTDPAKVAYKVLDTSKKYDPLGKKLRLRGAILGLRDAVVRFLQLLWALVTFRPGLVYFTCAPSIGLIARDVPYLYLLRLLRVPAVVHLRGGDAPRFFGRNPVSRFLIRHAMSWARTILVITPDTEIAASAIFGADKVVYAPNMIDDEKVAPVLERAFDLPRPDRPLGLIHVAWQAPAKGSLELIDALAAVTAPVDCQFVGRASDGNRLLLEDRIARLGLADRARLTGARVGKELFDTFAQADLFVFPSHTEGFPNVILEAMAFGLPILATDVGNIRQMIGAHTAEPAGQLVPGVPADPAGMAAAIDRLAAQPDLRRQLSESGRRRIQHFLATRVVPQLEEFLCDLCARGWRTMDKHRWGRCAVAQAPSASDPADEARGPQA